MADLGWTKYVNRLEDIEEAKCYEAALRAGYTQEEAQQCDGGDLNCPDCPWADSDPLYADGRKEYENN